MHLGAGPAHLRAAPARSCGLLALPTPCLPQRSPRLSHLLDICRCAKVAACGLQGALQAEPPSSRRCFASPTNLRSLNCFRRVKLSQGVGWGAENGSHDMRSLIFFRSDQGPLCYFQGPSLFTVTEIPNLTLPYTRTLPFPALFFSIACIIHFPTHDWFILRMFILFIFCFLRNQSSSEAAIFVSRT